MEKNLVFPRVLRIEVAASCNLACIHCPTGCGAGLSGIMDEKTFSQIFQQVEPVMPLIKVVVLYHGGEPLLNRNLEQWVAAFKGAGVEQVKIVTNAMLLTPERSQSLIDAGLDLIEVSLDGLSIDENHKIRKHSDFDVIMKNIEAFLSLKSSSLSAIRLLVSSTQIMPEPTHTAMPLPLPSTAPYLEKAFKPWMESQAVEGINTYWAMKWPHFPESDYFKVGHYHISDDMDCCDQVENTITVRANGDVVPCCYDLSSQLVMGNIHQQAITDIWTSLGYEALRTSITERKYLGICNQCNVVKKSAVQYLHYR